MSHAIFILFFLSSRFFSFLREHHHQQQQPSSTHNNQPGRWYFLCGSQLNLLILSFFNFFRMPGGSGGTVGVAAHAPVVSSLLAQSQGQCLSSRNFQEGNSKEASPLAARSFDAPSFEGCLLASLAKHPLESKSRAQLAEGAAAGQQLLWATELAIAPLLLCHQFAC